MGFSLDRRTVLRGALGGCVATLALPLLEPMMNAHATALAGGRPLPRRFGIFFWGNGVKVARWVPKQTGATWDLSDELAPLAKVKPWLTVVSGMEIKTGNERGHHAGTVGILSGAPMVSQPHPTSGYASTFRAPSIDQVVAAAIGKTTTFASLEVGVSRQVTDGEGTTLQYLSHRGPDNPNPPEYDPRRLFDRLFGAAGRPSSDGVTPLARERALGRSVLDVVAEDARRLRRQVSAADAARLEQHEEHVRAIERSLVHRSGTCGAGERPTQSAAVGTREPLAEINEAMARVLALGLSCDLTRVFSVLFSGSVGSTVFWQAGADGEHHAMTHDEPGDQPKVHDATVFTMSCLARLLEVLAETPDGPANLLDGSAILATSDCAEGREHTLRDYPILVAGRARGALHAGQHIRLPGENASTVLLSLLRAVGGNAKSFGQGGGRVDRGCPGLAAT